MTVKSIQMEIEEYRPKKFDYEDYGPESIVIGLVEEISQDDESDYQEAAKLALTSFEIRNEKRSEYLRNRRNRGN